MPYDFESDAEYEIRDRISVQAMPLRIRGDYDEQLAKRLTLALDAKCAKVRFKGEKWVGSLPFDCKETHGSFSIALPPGSLAEHIERYCDRIEALDRDLKELIRASYTRLDPMMLVPHQALYEQHEIPSALLGRLAALGVDLVVSVYGG